MERREGEADAELSARMRNDPAIQAFVAAAREYCAWFAAPPLDGLSEAHALLRLLPSLYLAGVRLPRDPPLPEEEAPERDAQPDGAVMPRRTESLPFRYYGATLHPTDLDKLFDVGTGDLDDDVSSVWSDVATGLLHWDAGDVIEAVWHWRFEFENHWGEHAVDALRALHEWFVEDSDRWIPSGA